MSNKKHTIDFIKSEFEKEGYQLLTTEYINGKQKLDYICLNGHKHSIRWEDWRQGCRCPYCAGNIKLTIDFIKSEFEKEGYQLLTDEYKNSKHHLDYICPKGHQHSIKWNNWKSGYRCTYCFHKDLANKQRQSLDFIKSEFEKEGYHLLTIEYINAQQKLNYVCPNGHHHSISWSNWKNGYRCKQCGYDKLADKYRLSVDFIKSEFEKEGYQLLTTNYINSKQKLDYICSNGHQHSIAWTHWNNGHRCRICADINNSGPGNQQWRGGISFEPYCPIWKDKEYKSDIRNRDGNTCLNPICFHNNNDKLVIHHIDYNKKNCNPNNLITVCNSCNSRANTDRKWHTAWYRTILNKRYNYNLENFNG